ncbi:2-polyprenyl-6-methoxyphenol hydroxylase-like FAD-dependent oxidoreductase [Bradyrhizobium sp. LM3.6]
MFRALDPATLKQHLRGFHRGWHDPIPAIIDAAENIVVTDTLDVATLPTWSRKRSLLIGDAAHATSPHAGQGASLALEDAMRLARLMQQGQELGATFQAFEAERRPRAEKIVALARRNGNSKREFQRHRRLDPQSDDEVAAAAGFEEHGVHVRIRRAGGVVANAVMPAKAGIQYAATSRFDQCHLWDTGSSGQAGR